MSAELPTREIVVSLNPDMPLAKISTKAALEGCLTVGQRGRGNPSENVPGMYKKLRDHGLVTGATGERERVTVLMESKQWDKFTQPPENSAFRLFWTTLAGIRQGVLVNDNWTPLDREGRDFHDPQFSEEMLRDLQERAISWFRDLVLEVVSQRYQVQWVDTEGR